MRDVLDQDATAQLVALREKRISAVELLKASLARHAETHATLNAVVGEAEVARRLSAEVRSEDVLCRWGGEEFLVLAPGLAGEPLDRLAQRLLAAVGDAPVQLPGEPPLVITASLGYAGFPLPGQGGELGWEAAVNLVDMALYTAKGHGRDCAVGLLGLSGADAATVAQDFESARVRGQVTLHMQGRPVPTR